MFHEVTPNPIEDIQGAITAETKDVMRGDIFNLTGLLKEEELRDDGDSLEKDGKSPDDFKGSKTNMKYQGTYSCTSHEKLNTKSIINAIVSVLVADVNEINGVGRRGEEENLHDGVVEGKSGMPWLGEKKIEITSGEDDHVQNLSSEGNTGA